MQPAHPLTFERYTLDLANEQLWHDNHLVPLTTKAFAVLRFLVEHSGQLVTKAELFDVLWPGTAVSDGALTFCIVELRKALSDDAKAPRFIETVHRRGYRFLEKVVSSQHSVVSSGEEARGWRLENRSPSPQASSLKPLVSPVVGRETDLTQLHQWLDKAVSGERQLVFVTGEPGIGKTTLVETFLHDLASRVKASLKSEVRSPKFEPAPSPQPLTPGERLWWGRGQCIEQYGPGEPYMPILEALGRLCRQPGGELLVTLLKHNAPTWLVQIPSLLEAVDFEALQRQTAGATRERMLREMGDAMAAITAERPLVLWLEDLHWSDASTLELLALLARRREPARLLIVGTYRPVDVIVQEHPLRTIKQELQLHGLCAELPLGLLSEEQVAKYLTMRFTVEATSQSLLQALAKTIHQRTDGNPLFMVTAIDDLITQEMITKSDEQWQLRDDLATVETRVPDSLQQLIAQQIERLNTGDRYMLEVASIAGMEFSAAAVAAGTETANEVVEEHCEGFARQGRFLQASGTADWPDGTVAARYSFLHALYQQVLYERIPAGRRQRLHQQIGEREERAYGERAREIATELAVHFEQARDYPKAVQYLQQAGERAIRRSAYTEAISHLTKGLEVLETLPDTPERAQQELRLLKHLGPALISEKGFTAVEVEHTYARAYDLCRRGENPYELIYVLQGLQIFHLVRGEVHKAQELAEQGFQLAQRLSTPAALMAGHAFLVEPFYFLGELTVARAHLEQAWSLYNPQEHDLGFMQHWVDPGVGLLSYLAVTSLLLGYPDQAQQRLHEGLAWAERLSHPYSSGSILVYACGLHSVRDEWQQVRERAEEVIRLSTEQGFPYLFAQGTALRGQALVVQGQVEDGIAQIQQSLAFFRVTGAELARLGFLPALAAAYARAGQVEEGLAVLAEALTVVDNTGMRMYEARLYVMKGELTLQKSGVRSPESEGKKRSRSAKTTSQLLNPNSSMEAEACFRKAIEVSRQQQAKSLELRATMSLARLWQLQGKHHEAHKMLSEVYNWFTEGFDTKDLQEANTLIQKANE